MFDETAAVTAATPKKKAKTAAKKPEPSYPKPKISEMVTDALTSLNERDGSPLHSIRKHIISNHKAIPINLLIGYIKHYLKDAVVSGSLVVTKKRGKSRFYRLKRQKTKKDVSVSGGEDGQMSTNCPTKRPCYLCRKKGHKVIDCPDASSKDGGKNCLNCGEDGHMFTNCPTKRACFKCHNEGHMAKDCPFAKDDTAKPRRIQQDDPAIHKDEERNR